MCRSMCPPLCRLRLVKPWEREQTGRRRSAVELHPTLDREPERKYSMKVFAVSLLVAFCTALVSPPPGVQAAPFHIPATVYPPGAHISYRPVLTNAEMDCMW